MGDDNRRMATSSSSTSTNLLGAAASTTRSGRTSPGVDPARVLLKSGVKESARIGQGASNVVDVQSTQMTWIFFLVSLIAVIFLAPFVVLRSLQVSKSFDLKQQIQFSLCTNKQLRRFAGLRKFKSNREIQFSLCTNNGGVSQVCKFKSNREIQFSLCTNKAFCRTEQIWMAVVEC
jgi:hypothetical protein